YQQISASSYGAACVAVRRISPSASFYRRTIPIRPWRPASGLMRRSAYVDFTGMISFGFAGTKGLSPPMRKMLIYSDVRLDVSQRFGIAALGFASCHG